MDAKALLLERKKLFENVANIRHNKRTPIAAGLWSWKYVDAGVTLKNGLFHYDVDYAVTKEVQERYQFDAHTSSASLGQQRITSRLRGGRIRINANGDGLEVMDQHLMEREEYPEFIENPEKFNWTKAFPRYCGSDLTLGELKNAVMASCDYLEHCANLEKLVVEEEGAVVLMPDSQSIMLPFETFFQGHRGIKEASMDLRKCKSQLKEAMDIIFETENWPVFESCMSVSERGSGFVGDACLWFLGHTVTNPKQFEAVYWPYLKKILDKAVEKHMTLTFLWEGSMIHVADFFQDIPKGTLLFQVEQDNMKELRKKLPNVGLIGGLPTSILGKGSIEENISFVRQLIDDVGDGFAVAPDKMLAYPNDAKRENLLAVTEFLRTYEA